MISVICPSLNEEKYIEKILSFFVNSLPAQKELFIIDGGSTDATVAIVKEWEQKNSNIKLLHNPHKYVPQALNIGLKAAKGDIICRIDAHSEYAPDYFEKIIDTFNSIDTDITGGPCRVKYNSNFQQAVGLIISSPFGTGNSIMHKSNYTGYSDGVTFGAYKREVFKDVGVYDERLIRNQDDEFFYRAKSLGKKIYLNPEIKLWYYPRSNLKSFFKQYFQYGIFKPLVLIKIKSEIKLRHLIPSLFTLYFLSLPLSILSLLWIIPLGLYALLDVFFSFKENVKLPVKLYMLFSFPAIHFAYGSGLIYGFFTIKKRNKTPDINSTY